MHTSIIKLDYVALIVWVYGKSKKKLDIYSKTTSVCVADKFTSYATPYLSKSLQVQGGSQQTIYFSSSNIGKVPELKSLEGLEQYFIANFIEEDRRAAAVPLTVIGSQTYKILRDLCDPVLPKDKTLEDICVLLKRQFSPRISVFRIRIEFYEAKRNLTETINEWYVRIKNLAIPCSSEILLEEVLKDKFVTGLRRGKDIR
ncbi:hypothetical protein NQ317_007930 [Molorchus minor]|uniref:Retrotransposon gag domain-containing protein n=1 Tax=Molorchus minor TaxID=1323400 RepID=A0ABQ9JTB3_9CUCU|nr:hypothetical protein NQ317_007930 [Molorchus minor]